MSNDNGNINMSIPVETKDVYVSYSTGKSNLLRFNGYVHINIPLPHEVR
ncbi:MAG: hypothetical protein JWM47_4168 [Acidimicrobiales bacterium]|nr:hypothetical protein [Acidimicrobiales bacterium]